MKDEILMVVAVILLLAAGSIAEGLATGLEHFLARVLG